MNESAVAVTQPSADAAQLERVVTRLLELAKARGATQAEAAASAGAGLGVTVRLGEVETLEQTNDRGVAKRQRSRRTIASIIPKADPYTPAAACACMATAGASSAAARARATP